VDNINRPIEFGHPADVIFGKRELRERQQRILDALPGYGSETIVKKSAVYNAAGKHVLVTLEE
jgi:hypothetical protein